MGLLKQIQQSILTDSNVSTIRLISWYAASVTYGGWLIVVLTSLVSWLVNTRGAGQFTIPGWTEIVALTSAIVVTKGIQAFSKNDAGTQAGGGQV